MKPLIATFMTLFLFNTSWACPLGAKEDQLSFARVMRNFGRFIMPAELITHRGVNGEKVTDDELKEAIEKLSLVIGCANILLENPDKEELLPRGARELSGAEKSKYLDSYFFYMEEFIASVTAYQAIYIKLLAQPAAERNYLPLVEMTKKQDALIDRAHRKL